MARLNSVGTIIGQRGTGKTLFLLGSKYTAKTEDRQLQLKGLLDTLYRGSKKKVLIIDTIDHPSYRNFPILPQKLFSRFTKGIARVILRPSEIPELFKLINQSQHMWNSVIVCEDARKYTGKNLPKPIEELIIDSKQKNIDMVFMYHSFVDTPGDIFTKMDYIQLFKTEDHPEIRKNKMSQYTKVLAAYEEVKKNSSRFYGKFIDTRTE